jgi:flavin reductase (DIM6/NTAB) family NADH-FMN oxidoreductase RutF
MLQTPSISTPPEADGLAADDLAFRRAMRSLASAVVMVTVSVDQRPWGLTISSCRWLATMPPQILMSLGSRTVTCRQILSGGEFGVAVLGELHDELAARGAANGEAKFVDEYCEECDVGRPPRVRGAIHHLDCRLLDAHPHGDHTVVVASVEKSMREDDRAPGPLIYFDRSYRSLGEDLTLGHGLTL